jgi:hypothetical protein
MLEEDAPDPETATAVMKIRQAAERCPRIVKTFLAMARQQPPERVPVHLNELINAALDLVSYGPRTAGITVRFDLAPDLPMPDCNGIDLYRHLQASCPHILERLVFITGGVLGSTARGFLAETGAPYLEKPIIPRDVQRLLA